MEIIEEIKETPKEEKVNLHGAILSLKRSMRDYKAKRKMEWKSFKNKFNDDMDEVNKSFKRLKKHHEK